MKASNAVQAAMLLADLARLSSKLRDLHAQAPNVGRRRQVVARWHDHGSFEGWHEVHYGEFDLERVTSIVHRERDEVIGKLRGLGVEIEND